MPALSAGGKVAKATVWYVVCDFVVKGLSFITLPIFTRLMSVEEIGRYTGFSSWISILSVVVTLNLVPSILLARFDYEDEFDNFVSTAALLGMASALAFYLVCLPFSDTIVDVLGFEPYEFHLMGIYLVFCQVPGILVAKYRAIMEYKGSVMVSLGSAVAVTLVSLACTVACEDRFGGRVAGFCISSTVINAGLFSLLVFKKGPIRREYLGYALAICLPLVIHNLAGNIMHTSDRIMIERMDSAVAAGYYGVAYSCAMVANVLRNSLNSAWQPWVYERISGGREDEVRPSSFILLAAFSVLCLFLIMLAPEVLLIMGGETYAEAAVVVPPVVMAYLFSMVYSLYAGIEQYYKKQKFFAVVAVVCASLNIGLNLVAIPLFGYVSAAYTSLFCMALECVLHYLNVRRMGMHRLYSTKFNVLLLAAMGCLSCVALLLYGNPVARYLLTAVVTAAAGAAALSDRERLGGFIAGMKKEGRDA